MCDSPTQGSKEDIPISGCGALWGCEMSRIPHFRDSLLTDGCKVVSHMLRPCSTPQGLVRLEALGKLKQFIHLIGYETRGLPACSIVPQVTVLLRVPTKAAYYYIVGFQSRLCL
jgi:hypothetical protein